jgi:signal transduction histidine kinase/ligand-binding sensor protein
MKRKKDNENWTIYDLDVPAFERILKKASLGLGQSLFLLDTEGFFLTAPPKERPTFCRYVLDRPEGCRRCRESLMKGHKRVMEEGKSSIFSCHAGMVKVTAPVWVDSKIVAVLNGCTSLLFDDGSPFPRDKFARVIRELNVPDEIVNTLETAPKQKVTQTLDLLVAMANLIAETSAENLRTLQQVDEATKHIRRQNEKLIALYELNQILQSPLSLNEKLLVILTSLTSAEGFGFSRAMLLLLNDNMTRLEGRMGVGPNSQKEAKSARAKGRQALAAKGLYERIRRHEAVADRDATSFDDQVRSLSFSTREKERYPVATLFEKGPAVVQGRAENRSRIDPELGKVLGNVGSFVAIPLNENETPIGVIIADNRFSRRKIEKDTLQILSVFANQAATAISNSKLYSILQEKIFQLAESNRNLHKTHGRMLQMERFSIMGSVAAGVAHEIKNPLNAIVIYLELLKKEIAKEKPEKQKIAKKLNVVEEEIERLADMATEFLSYSDVGPLETSPIDIRILLDQVVRFLGYQAKEHQIEIRKQYAARLPEISVNHKQIKQVFINIFLNALQAMPDGGRLTISVGEAPERQDCLQVTFVDTGVGIPDDVLMHIFEPFYTTRKGGTGLGLSFVEKVLRDHGGLVTIRSEKDRGTRMELRLPYTAKGLETVDRADKTGMNR